MLFAATWMNLEVIILSEVSQRKTNVCAITYMWNLKKIVRMNFIYKIDTDSDKTNSWLPKEK